MRKVFLIESWTQLLFLSKRHKAEIHSFSNGKDIKELSYPREVLLCGNEKEKFLWV